ncbi:MAG: outer membrane protein assembly factor BamB family protein [Planctomycetota bacterium]
MLGLMFAGVLQAENNTVVSFWTQFRGPGGQGHAVGELPLRWGVDMNVIWKADVPGRGHSSPVVLGDQVWVTTAIETEASPEDAEQRLKASTVDAELSVLEKVDLYAVCFDRVTGERRYNIKLLTVHEPQAVHKINSYASPTPFLAPGRLYAHFGAYGTACVDTETGRVLWANNELHIQHEVGPGGSPVLWEGKLIFSADGSDRQFIAALDAETGAVAWSTPRSGELSENPQQKKSYGSPTVIDTPSGPRLVSIASDWLYIYHPETGSELARVPYGQLGYSVVPKPVMGDGMVFFSTGFGKKQMIALRYDGAGEPEVAWRARGAPTIASPMLVGDALYFVSDSGGIVTCLDALSGKTLWRHRLGGNHAASPLYAGGYIYLFDGDGRTTVFKPGDAFKQVAENTLPGAVKATPAAAGGSLFIRTEDALYRIGPPLGK